MNRFRLALFAPALLLLVACAALGPLASIASVATSVATPAAAAGDKVVLEGTRGLILAHNAVQGAIAVVNPLVRNRVLTSAQVDRYEQIINEVEKLSAEGRTTLTVAQRATAMFNLANELNRMAGK